MHFPDEKNSFYIFIFIFIYIISFYIFKLKSFLYFKFMKISKKYFKLL